VYGSSSEKFFQNRFFVWGEVAGGFSNFSFSFLEDEASFLVFPFLRLVLNLSLASWLSTCFQAKTRAFHGFQPGFRLFFGVFMPLRGV